MVNCPMSRGISALLQVVLTTRACQKAIGVAFRSLTVAGGDIISGLDLPTTKPGLFANLRTLRGLWSAA